MQVSRWGNSLAIRLPASVVEVLKLQEGDDIEVTIAGERAFEVSRRPGRRDLLARLRQYRGTLPEGFRFERDDANGRR